jgi:hypothetical protein
METIRQILIDAEHLEMLPAKPAVYTLLEYGYGPGEFVCRYVGEAADLREALQNHFDPQEPNITLRYFMLSEKIKFLSYEVLNETQGPAYREMIENWRQRFNSGLHKLAIAD